MKRFFLPGICLLAVMVQACTGGRRGNEGQLPAFDFSATEAAWVRNGEPIEFEGELWYPQDGVEIFLDSEVMLMGEYRDVQFFLDKMDVRPFERLYTKFARNKFRYYKRKPSL